MVIFHFFMNKYVIKKKINPPLRDVSELIKNKKFRQSRWKINSCLE